MSDVSEILNKMEEKPRSLVRVTEIIPEWIVGSVYKSGGFIFLLREMDTEGMTLEILETHIADAELLQASSLANSAQSQMGNIMRDQNDKTMPLDPTTIVSRG